jgi:hypothetical protein
VIDGHLQTYELVVLLSVFWSFPELLVHYHEQHWVLDGTFGTPIGVEIYAGSLGPQLLWSHWSHHYEPIPNVVEA